MSQEMIQIMIDGFFETLYMTFLSTAIAYVIGLPMGIFLVTTDKDGLTPNLVVNKVLNVIVNIVRSLPFLILLIAVVPITRAIAGTSIGSTATIIPLVIASAPYIARLVEGSLREVDHGIIEAMLSMGARPQQIILKGMLKEALPSLINGAAIATTTILGYSAMAGIVGGGGLGAIAINYGYYRTETLIMLIAVVVLVLVVQIIQAIGDRIALKIDKRKK